METATPPPREYLLLSWEERGEWHRDYLSIRSAQSWPQWAPCIRGHLTYCRVHPVLNTVLFKLVFFFLSTSLIFQVTITVALAMVKLVEVISAFVQVQGENFLQMTKITSLVKITINLYDRQHKFSHIVTKENTNNGAW